jgi:hypothetical protein
MSEFHISARNIAGINITNWKIQASDGIVFTEIFAPISTAFNVE